MGRTRIGGRRRPCSPTRYGPPSRSFKAHCSPPGNGHRGSERYGYDFDTPIGTEFIAIRAGVVVHVEQSHTDGQIAPSALDNTP